MKYGHTDDEEEILTARFRNSKFYPCTSCDSRYRKKRALLAHLKYFHKIDPEMGVDLSKEIERESFCKQCDIDLEPRDFHHHMSIKHSLRNDSKNKKAKDGHIESGLNFFCDFCNKSLPSLDGYGIIILLYFGYILIFPVKFFFSNLL